MLNVFLFDLKNKLGTVSTWVYFGIFYTIATLWMLAAGGVFPEVTINFGDKVFINSPYAIAQTINFLGYFGVIIIAAMMGRAVQQDHEFNIWHFYYSAPLKKWEYLGGRFLAALICLLIIFSSIAVAIWVASHLPFIRPNAVGPSIGLAYLTPYLQLLLPNLIFLGGLFFSIGALTRKMMPVYILGVILFISFLISGSLMREIDNRHIAALLDPFGMRATSLVTDYWSIYEKNHHLIPFEGALLKNRLIWLGLGIVLMSFTYLRFQFQALNINTKAKKENSETPTQIKPPKVNNQFNQAATLALLFAQVKLNLKETIKNIYFVAIALCGLLFMIVASDAVTKMYGTSTYPITYTMLMSIEGGFGLFMLIITTFYAGELIWRERENRIAQILDAAPIPDWIPVLAKTIALIGLQACLLACTILFAIAIQLAKGYTQIELGLYLYHLFTITLPGYAFLAVFAIFVQTVSSNKYLAYFIVIAFQILLSTLGLIGLEHPLWQFSNLGEHVYSEMNGYGHYLAGVRWMTLYWTGFCALLFAASVLLWQRGTGASFKERLQAAKLRFNRVNAGIIVAGLACFIGSGFVIFHFTNSVNKYETKFQKEAAQASYEKNYRRYLNAPLPRITDVSVKVDLFPSTRSVNIKGQYVLENKTNKAISTLYLTLDSEAEIRRLNWDKATTLTKNDKELNFSIYQLNAPLNPGEKIHLDFDLGYAGKWFAGMSRGDRIYKNGTFITTELVPQIGYIEGIELSNEKTRKKHGLSDKERMRERDDPEALANSYISSQADWINFDAIVSTESDQTAYAPGTLIKEWKEGDRRYFHYKPEGPILNFYAFLSGRYASKKAMWKDIPIEINYHPGHEYNLDRMIEGVQLSLDYYTKNFGPYQHKIVRIIEFPRYGNFAQAFPNTIPFSESIGFVAKVDPANEKDLDYPVFVTAHEVAHQWWAHQVVAANSKGATTLVETLAEYSALMIMKHRYGEQAMRRFLQFELNNYLLGRSQESRKELPLAQNENQQYIHYNKGSLIMYLLQDQLGEATVNQALRKLITDHAFKAAPYPNGVNLVNALKSVSPLDTHALIDDAMERITFYDLRALNAQAKSLGHGEYEVTFKVQAGKKYMNGEGEEKDANFDEYVHIGVDDVNGKPLLREKRRINTKESSYTVKVKGHPGKAGIDPDYLFIDRKINDNLIKVDIN